MNKLLVIIYLILLSGGALSAQNASSPAVSTSNLKWDNRYRWPNLNGMPELPPLRRGSISNTPDWGGQPFPPSGKLSTYYVYQATFSNKGEKKIKGLSWKYVFSDMTSREKLKSHRFISAEKIGVKKSVIIKGNSPAAPTPVVSAESLEKGRRSPYLERIAIKCVVYADNSVWTAADADPRHCNFLIFLIKRGERFH